MIDFKSPQTQKAFSQKAKGKDRLLIDVHHYVQNSKIRIYDNEK